MKAMLTAAALLIFAQSAVAASQDQRVREVFDAGQLQVQIRTSEGGSLASKVLVDYRLRIAKVGGRPAQSIFNEMKARRYKKTNASQSLEGNLVCLYSVAHMGWSESSECHVLQRELNESEAEKFSYTNSQKDLSDIKIGNQTALRIARAASDQLADGSPQQVFVLTIVCASSGDAAECRITKTFSR